MHFSQLFLLRFTFQGKFYINCSLSFGAASSCQIFEKVACALQWIITNQTGCVYISHFLDDFPLLGISHDDVCLFILDFYKIMDRIGMPVAKEKTLGPTDMLEYLGLIFNFIAQHLEIPEKKRFKVSGPALQTDPMQQRQKKGHRQIDPADSWSIKFHMSGSAHGQAFPFQLVQTEEDSKW